MKIYFHTLRLRCFVEQNISFRPLFTARSPTFRPTPKFRPIFAPKKQLILILWSIFSRDWSIAQEALSGNT